MITFEEARYYINYGIKEGYIQNEDYWIELEKRDRLTFTIEAEKIMDRADAQEDYEK